MSKPPPEVLRRLIRYEPSTGRMFWMPRSVEYFTRSEHWTAEQLCRRWNTRYAGCPALAAPKGNGYLHGPVLGRYILAHRVAWAIHYGDEPEHQIDHINGDRSDNRIQNLRDVPPRLNSRNRRIAPGCEHSLGVAQGKSGNWYARIRGDESGLHLGTYPTQRAAVAARMNAEAALGYRRNTGERT